MVLASKEKPSIDEIANYLKQTIPHCSITQSEIELFKPVYERASYNDLQKIFHKAAFMNAPQPISFMTRQLQLIAPPKADSNNRLTHDWQGRTIESGTDWQAKYAEIDRRNEIKRENYDAKHGAGSYDRNMKQYRADLHKWFVGLCDKKSLKELQPLSKKIDQNGKELGIEVYQ